MGCVFVVIQVGGHVKYLHNRFSFCTIPWLPKADECLLFKLNFLQEGINTCKSPTETCIKLYTHSVLLAIYKISSY